MTDPRSEKSTQPPVAPDREGQDHVQPTQTRGASKEGVVRWVLIGSMILIIVAMTAVWVTGAATMG